MAFLRRLCKCNDQMIRNLSDLNTMSLHLKRSVHASVSLRSNGGGDGWLSKLLMVRKIDPGKDSHSRLLSDTEIIYEMQFHNVKPDSHDAYIKNYENWTNELQSKDSKTVLVGSWRVEIGDMDQYVHVWKFQEGYLHASKVQQLIRTDNTLQKIVKEQLPTLRKRQNQFMLPFSFWGHPEPQVHNHFYEMRSYILKPGTMIEWGNNWARGITFRKSNAIAGFFSQIGQMYTVHHIWRYEDLQKRKDTREDAWRKPGWDECVAYTVPLIDDLKARWMSPNHFSPIR